MIISHREIAMGMYAQTQRTCEVCNGKGKIAKSKCHVCHGSKVGRKDEILTIDIPPGTPFGHRFKFERKGDEFPDHIPGDLYIEIKHDEQKARFRRIANHLYFTIHLNLREALLGFKKTLVHLDGHKLILERTGVTQQGFVQVLPNKGMPYFANPFRSGNLYVKYETVFPTSLSNTEIEGFTKLFSAI
ncbi:DnaJ- protein scj1 [Coelomomyces lativittatus]|nr:DnaJ- protein scj1 [Coelomomyces lativittatus]KAJ1502987.1 DnaJ- protein scj1 [Coelomomyces lativittatus]KAJ1504887.1 DnaJ- protein scj1 [Coelomomyces lativittatus]